MIALVAIEYVGKYPSFEHEKLPAAFALIVKVFSIQFMEKRMTPLLLDL